MRLLGTFSMLQSRSKDLGALGPNPNLKPNSISASISQS